MCKFFSIRDDHGWDQVVLEDDHRLVFVESILMGGSQFRGVSVGFILSYLCVVIGIFPGIYVGVRRMIDL